MPLDRRSFLIGASAAAVACKGESAPTPPEDAVPAGVRETSPALPEPAEALDDAVFPWSVGFGDPTPDGVVARVRTDASALELVILEHDGSDWTERERLSATPDWTASVEVSGLEPDTPYAAYAVADGVRSRVGLFRTAPAPGRQVRLLGTSCMGYRANHGAPSLSFMAEADPDAILLLGDTSYTDGNERVEEYRAHWDMAQSRPTVRDLFAAGAVVATWDDHEVANNWRLGESSGRQTGITQEWLEVATAVWQDTIPMREGGGDLGVWRSLDFGDVELFVLDCRGERSEGAILSAEQLAWLEDGLAASTAVFKVILVSVHVCDHYALIGTVEDRDRWQGYPEQRAALVAAAAATPGALFVTGDMHYGGIQRVDPEGGPGWDLYEVAVGPGSSNTLFPVVAVAEIGGDGVPAQYETLVEDHSFSILDFDPGLRTVTVRFVGDAGEVLAEQVLQL